MTKNIKVATRLNVEDYSLLQRFIKEHYITNYQALKILLRKYYNVYVKNDKNNYGQKIVLIKIGEGYEFFETIKDLLKDERFLNLSKPMLRYRLNKQPNKSYLKKYKFMYKNIWLLQQEKSSNKIAAS